MVLSAASQPLVSMKLTESASTSTCFAGGQLAASAAFNPSSKWPILAKNMSPSATRRSSSPERPWRSEELRWAAIAACRKWKCRPTADKVGKRANWGATRARTVSPMEYADHGACIRIDDPAGALHQTLVVVVIVPTADYVARRLVPDVEADHGGINPFYLVTLRYCRSDHAI